MNDFICIYISDIIFPVVLSEINVDKLTRLPRKSPTEDAITSPGDSPTMKQELRDNLTQLTDPTVIADCAGNIIVWYLPNGMSSPNQVGTGSDGVCQLE